ncbi:hypothetical protein M9H77_18452 [Catharanthus roseus]|uniref:Uncharacterized protein n=1 Tax=Catharanthus roseus TaxID=4058 RepID=A0ACC0B7G5_CATRO|nr:hypothetical protein M9H77_18452 [Catharanthus roseus]
MLTQVKLRDRNPASSHKIKKTTQTSLRASSSQAVEDDDEAGESYNTSDDEEDEAEMRTTFEQLWINQEIQGIQLTKIVESTRCYVDELAH